MKLCPPPNPKVVIFATGEPTPGHGGSGFKNLVLQNQRGFLRADIMAVVSNHPEGGVRDKARELDIPFRHFPKPRNAEAYRSLMEEYDAKWAILSGYLLPVRGLRADRTINIHPAWLPEIGGKDCHGDLAHEASLKAFKEGRITHSAVSMHFVTDFSVGGYDTGPLFFRYPIEIKENDTVETLRARVNAAEHICQPIVTQLVLDGVIHWDGVDPKSLVTPFPVD